MRDFIINLFRQNKTRKLTFNECRQKLASDVSCIYRLWSFLDHWGLINFMPDWKDSDPTVLPLIQAGGLPAGAKVVSAPSAPSNLFAFRDASSAAAVKAATSGGNAFSILNRRDQYGLSAVTPMSQQPARFFCNADTSHDCTALRYHCTSIPDVDICSECFANGRFPIGMTSKNFVRIEQCAKEVGSLEKSVIDIAVYLSLYGLQGDGHWTEQETLLLLEVTSPCILRVLSSASGHVHIYRCAWRHSAIFEAEG